ncbi:MAG: ferrochelatase [Gemmatimonadales bacterium]
MNVRAVPHLLLVNLGTPTAPLDGAVRQFLDEFLSDPSVVDLPRWLWLPILKGIVLKSRPKRVAQQYASIWTAEGSPLRVATERIAKALECRAQGRYTVGVAYRYGEPSLDAALVTVANTTSGPVIVVPLFPQRTDATTGTMLRRAREAAVRAGVADRLVERLVVADEPGYVAAMACRWNEAVADAPTQPEHIVVSFHGIPVRYDRRERSVYAEDCRATMLAFLKAIEWPESHATLAFQSRFGPEAWLTPATADVLEELPRRGVRRVAVITPGFVTDGLETIEEIGIRGRERFLEAGGTYLLRVGAVEDHPAFLDALEGLAFVNGMEATV